MYLEDGIEDALKSVGICPICRLRFAEPSSYFCSECLEIKRKRARKYRAKNKDNPDWKKKEANKSKNRYYKSKMSGHCVCCGKPRGNSKSTIYCTNCYAKKKIYYENNKWKKNKKVY